MLAIDELLKRKPSQLSGGQRQRVAMGRAIVRESDACLMDELLSNRDAKLRVEMRAYVPLLHQQLGTTTVYVTHDQTEAMSYSRRGTSHCSDDGRPRGGHARRLPRAMLS